MDASKVNGHNLQVKTVTQKHMMHVYAKNTQTHTAQLGSWVKDSTVHMVLMNVVDPDRQSGTHIRSGV